MRRYTEQVQVTLPAARKLRWQARAQHEGISLSELMRHIVDQPGLGSKDF